MSKILTLMIFAAVIFYGCDSKAPACTTLSWGETSQIEENGVELKYSAGTRCENIDDYYDVSPDDIERAANTVKSLRLTLKTTSKCTQEDSESGMDVEVECPGYVPDIIEFGDVEGCKFETPPDENTDCLPGGLTFYTSSSAEYFEKVGWSFFPPENINETNIPKSFFSFREDDISMVGEFGKDSNAIIKFTEVEYTDEGKEEKEFTLEYSLVSTE